MSGEQARQVSEAEALDEIHRVLLDVAKRFGNQYFASHTGEDIVQSCYVFGLEALQSGSRYDPSRCLGRFLFAHMKNRLYNKKRAEYWRAEAPCKCCDPWDPGPEPCKHWVVWRGRNEARRALAGVMSGGPGPVDREDPSEQAVADDLDAYIRGRLEPEMVGDYLLLVGGEELDADRREQVRAACREIVAAWAEAPRGRQIRGKR